MTPLGSVDRATRPSPGAREPIDEAAICSEAYSRATPVGRGAFSLATTALPSAMRQETSVRVADLIKPDSVIADLKVADKARALRELARRAAPFVNVSEAAMHDALTVREGLGSTGVGAGIAIPHARIAGLTGLYGLFARLGRPIDFQAIDGRPVDLVFLLLVPESAGSEHLAALACVSRALRNPATAKLLRGTTEAAALYAILTDKSVG